MSIRYHLVIDASRINELYQEFNKCFIGLERHISTITFPRRQVLCVILIDDNYTEAFLVMHQLPCTVKEPADHTLATLEELSHIPLIHRAMVDSKNYQE